ncbi:MAG TPA: hypothetical protein VE088_06560 [Gaiellaceae bacterium]|jgi:hypothetical protein|nr:hypothetical protein [Gaiellaceae bacterium]
MTKAILSVGAVLAAAVALAGCGGGGSSVGGTVSTPAGTTGGVAGVSTSKTSTTITASSGSSSFSTTVQNLYSHIKKSVHQFENGDVAAAASSGGSVLANCTSTVNNDLAPHATNSSQKQAVQDLRKSCTYMHKAASAGGNGNLTGAKNWAKKALQQAKFASQQVGG